MVAAAPHREQIGSTELCSLWQQQGRREQHGAVPGEDQQVTERVCPRRCWSSNGLPSTVGTALSYQSSRTVWTPLSDKWSDFCVEPGVELDGQCSLFQLGILCDSDSDSNERRPADTA